VTHLEYEAALAELETLMGTGEQPDRICQLAATIEQYELQHYPIAEPTPEEAAAFRREQEKK
jgi:antitoxin component HigA of HigAB toxin-antitoxin module